jgi:K(+)-stimulated pyrophosphate-energized sodium pump
VTFFRTFPRLAARLIVGSFALWLVCGSTVLASEAQLAIPDLHVGHFTIAGQEITAWNLLFYGALVITGTLGISLYLRNQIKNLPAHESMLNISEIIFQT